VIEVREFTAAGTSALDLLKLFKEATGEEGFVELGREIVLEFRCTGCGRVEASGRPVSVVDEAELVCETCGGARELKTSHVVQSGDSHASWPLARLAVPRLEILEVRGPVSARWYELTGDAAEMAVDQQPSAAGSNLVLSV
jgi:hypothetical protein